jgi:hypothetical protein
MCASNNSEKSRVKPVIHAFFANQTFKHGRGYAISRKTTPKVTRGIVGLGFSSKPVA